MKQIKQHTTKWHAEHLLKLKRRKTLARLHIVTYRKGGKPKVQSSAGMIAQAGLPQNSGAVDTATSTTRTSLSAFFAWCVRMYRKVIKTRPSAS